MLTNQTQNRIPLPHVQVAACPVCGETAYTIFRENAPVDMRSLSNLPDAFKVQKFMLVRCNKCSLVYLSNRPANDDLEVYYGIGYGANYKQTLLINLAHKVYDFIHYTRLKKHLLNAAGVQNNGSSTLTVEFACTNATPRHFGGIARNHRANALGCTDAKLSLKIASTCPKI